MDLLQHLFKRQLGIGASWRKTPLDFSLSQLSCQSVNVSHFHDDPFLSTNLHKNHLLVTSERGCIQIIKSDVGKSPKVTSGWLAHGNAVFDAKWRPGHGCDQILAVSGDQSFTLWDVNKNNTPIGCRKSAHLSTIKSVSFRDENVFATGSRDGTIAIWDLRMSPSNSYSRVNSIPDAHLTSVVPLKGRGRQNSCLVRSSPLSSITCILFKPESDHIFSSGASDGVIKLWDIRSLKKANIQTSTKKGKGSSPRPSALKEYGGIRGHGFSSLTLDNEGRIFGSCSDHRIYAFNVSGVDGDILAAFSGRSYRTNNYTRIKVVNDFLLSGSVEGSTPIWSLSDMKKSDRNVIIKPKITLCHHDEVTAVEGDDLTFEFFTCSDNQMVHRWSLHNLVKKDGPPINLPVVKVYEPSPEEISKIVPDDNSGSTRYGSVPVSTSPLATLTGWLAQSANVNQEIPTSPSKIKKRSLSKENINDQTTPDSSLHQRRITSSEPQRKKRRRQTPIPTLSSKKISEYFQR